MKSAFLIKMEISSLLHSGYQHELTRKWNSSPSLNASNLMFPVFIHAGKEKEPIDSLPNQSRYSLDSIQPEFEKLVQKGLKSILIFGVPFGPKDPVGSGADSQDSVVIRAIKIFKNSFPSLLIACDVCLCAYTCHGHCGIMDSEGNLDNQKSIERLAQVAVEFAKAGCQLIAPSDMVLLGLMIGICFANGT
jgi:porphobilinogen synthase